jgi:hypothetical protein
MYKSLMRRAAGVGPADALPPWASFVAGAMAGARSQSQLLSCVVVARARRVVVLC